MKKIATLESISFFLLFLCFFSLQQAHAIPITFSTGNWVTDDGGFEILGSSAQVVDLVEGVITNVRIGDAAIVRSLVCPTNDCSPIYVDTVSRSLTVEGVDSEIEQMLIAVAQNPPSPLPGLVSIGAISVLFTSGVSKTLDLGEKGILYFYPYNIEFESFEMHVTYEEFVRLQSEPIVTTWPIVYGAFLLTDVPTTPPQPPQIPEPSTILLLGTGLAGFGIAAWRRKKV
jgi:hypothetical protein